MEKYLTVAKIVKPQGIRGELKVIAMTDSAQDLTAFTKVYVGGNAYKLLKVRPQGDGCAFITLSGIADRNAAELMRGLDVEALREDAPALPEGRYYIVDVIGCTAQNTDGEILGKVTGVTPARTDIYTVEKEDGTRLVFPAAEGVVSDVNVEEGLVILNTARLAQVVLEEK